MTPRREVIGSAELWLGDCREVLPALPRPAAIVSDPPYGQSYRHAGNVRTGRHRTAVMWERGIAGDDAPFDPAHMLGAADVVLLWGAHKFAERLPGGTWLVWDKVPTGKVRDQGDGEAAWLSGDPRPLRIFRHLWDGVCVAGPSLPEVVGGRQHPTQKPVAVMSWSLEQAAVPAGGVVCDPYMGSGTTGVAAVRAGFPFVGCEVDPRHFETACRRLEEAHRQPALFAAAPPALPPAKRAKAPAPADLFGGGAS